MMWATVATELAGYGLNKLAEGLKKGPVQKTAVEIASRLNVAPTPEAVNTALVSDPDALQKLLALEQARHEMTEESRDNANKRQGESWVPKVLSVVTPLMLATAIGGLFFREIPPENKDLIVVLITAVATAYATVMGFWFGSSIGSKTKEEAANR